MSLQGAEITTITFQDGKGVGNVKTAKKDIHTVEIDISNDENNVDTKTVKNVRIVKIKMFKLKNAGNLAKNYAVGGKVRHLMSDCPTK